MATVAVTVVAAVHGVVAANIEYWMLYYTCAVALLLLLLLLLLYSAGRSGSEFRKYGFMLPLLCL